MPEISGPFFQNPGGIVDAAIREAEMAVAREAEEMVQDRLRVVLRHPTGRYQRRIRVAETGGVVRVDDSNTIYGPWLEGTSRMNERTRFKGYATFRHVSQQVERQAQTIAERVIDRYVRRLR